MNARIQERAEVRINRGTDREYLLPDQLRFEWRAEMVRQLLADSIPVGLVVRFIAFIIVPHRAGMAADKVRDGNGGMQAAFLMEWLGTDGIIVIAGCGFASGHNPADKTADYCFFEGITLESMVSYPDENMTNIFLPG
jgi:hypothetical protein